MNWDQIAGKWTELKGSARSHWGDLTDDELDQVQGDREQFEGLLQQKYGKAKEDVRAEVDSWLASMDRTDA